MLLIPTIKVVFTGELNQCGKYEELAKCWLIALIQKEAVHMLALALQKIKSFEDRFAKILGPELVRYYHRAYYRGKDTGTNLGRFKVDILQVLDSLVIPAT